jgi:hypothetical protein
MQEWHLYGLLAVIEMIQLSGGPLDERSGPDTLTEDPLSATFASHEAPEGAGLFASFA